MRIANDIGFYDLATLPGCAQVAVSTHVFINPHLRGQGHGKTQHQERLGEMIRQGYDYALCTVRSDNEPQLRIMKRHGWDQLAGFDNRVSGNHVLIFGRPLVPPVIHHERPIFAL